MDFQPIQTEECFEKPYFTTIGMTDESCASVYGYATGTISRQYMEESEEIEVVLADREEVARILREENVAIMCAYQLMHFLKRLPNLPSQLFCKYSPDSPSGLAIIHCPFFYLCHKHFFQAHGLRCKLQNIHISIFGASLLIFHRID